MKIHYVSQRELAYRWNTSEGTLERWRSEGIGPRFLKLHGQIRYRIEDVEQYELDCARKSTVESKGKGKGKGAKK